MKDYTKMTLRELETQIGLGQNKLRRLQKKIKVGESNPAIEYVIQFLKSLQEEAYSRGLKPIRSSITKRKQRLLGLLPPI